MASAPKLYAKDDIEDVMQQLKDEAGENSSDEDAEEYVPSQESLASDGEDDEEEDNLTNSPDASGEEFSDDDAVETDELAARIAHERGEASEPEDSEESNVENESDELRRTDSVSTTADTECDWKEESQDSESMRKIPRAGRQMLTLQRAVDGKSKKAGNGILQHVSCFVMYQGIVCGSKRGITSEHVAKISVLEGCTEPDTVIFCVPVKTEKHGLVYAELTSSEELAAIRESFRTKGLKRAAQMRTLVSAQSKADTHGVFDLVRKLDVKGFGPYVTENGNEKATIISNRLKGSRNTLPAGVATEKKGDSPRKKVVRAHDVAAAPAPMDVESVQRFKEPSVFNSVVSTPPKKRPVKRSDGVARVTEPKPPRKESKPPTEDKERPLKPVTKSKSDEKRTSRKRKTNPNTQRDKSKALSSISEERPARELQMKEFVSTADVTVTSSVDRAEDATESQPKRVKTDDDHIRLSFTIALPQMSSALNRFLLDACKSAE